VRNVLWTVLPCVGLALTALPAQAQSASSTNMLSSGMRASTFSSGSSQAVVNQPIDTSQSIAPFPVQSGSSYLTSFFQNLHLPFFGGSSLPSGPFPSLSYPSGQSLPFKAANNLSPTGFTPITSKAN
jgi:hypothetical protein